MPTPIQTAEATLDALELKPESEKADGTLLSFTCPLEPGHTHALLYQPDIGLVYIPTDTIRGTDLKHDAAVINYIQPYGLDIAPFPRPTKH